MTSSAWMPVLRFVIAGTVVVAATRLAGEGRTLAGALVGALPYITILVLAFGYLDSGRDAMRLAEMSRYFTWLILAAASFPLAFGLALRLGLPVGAAFALALTALAAAEGAVVAFLAR
jgi:hypothetical protein